MCVMLLLFACLDVCVCVCVCFGVCVYVFGVLVMIGCRGRTFDEIREENRRKSAQSSGELCECRALPINPFPM